MYQSRNDPNEGHDPGQGSRPDLADGGQDSLVTAGSHQYMRSRSKVCVVCGDRALSCNFGAITCESCKAFFRRHASKNISTQCDGNCTITMQTRAYCRRCRLLKCYTVGMRKELILTEEQKKQRRQKVEDNRLRRQAQEMMGLSGGHDLSLTPSSHYDNQVSSTCWDMPTSASPHDEYPITSGLPKHPDPESQQRYQISAHQQDNPPPAFSPYGHLYCKPEQLDTLPSAHQDSGSHNSQLPSQSLSQLPPQGVPPGTSSRYGPYSEDAVNSWEVMEKRVKLEEAGHGDVSGRAEATTYGAKLPMPSYSDAEAYQHGHLSSEDSQNSQSESRQGLHTKPESDMEENLPAESSMVEAEGLAERGSPSNSQGAQSPAQTQYLTTEVPDHILKEMPEEHQETMVEVLRAFNLSFNKPLPQNMIHNPNYYTDMFNMGQLTIRRLIKMAKHLKLFMALQQADQVTMLKRCAMDVMILRSSKAFSANVQGWYVVDDGSPKKVSAETMKVTSVHTAKYYVKYCQFSSLMSKVTQNDDVILMFLIIMSIFCLAAPGLIDIDKIQQSRAHYCEVLRSYLAIRFENPALLEKAESLLDFLTTEMSDVQSLILSSKVDSLEPLIKEIFDV